MKIVVLFASLILLVSCEETNYDAMETESFPDKNLTQEFVSESSNEFPEGGIPAIPDEIGPFIPRGYDVLDFKVADLNGDSLNDVLLIVKNEYEDTCFMEPANRPLLILMRGEDGELILFKRNNETVLCSSCGGVRGDPYRGLSVKGKYFSIEHFGAHRIVGHGL